MDGSTDSNVSERNSEYSETFYVQSKVYFLGERFSTLRLQHGKPLVTTTNLKGVIPQQPLFCEMQVRMSVIIICIC